MIIPLIDSLISASSPSLCARLWPWVASICGFKLKSMDAFTLRHNFIKPQPWELRLSNALSGIGFDQMRMTLSILACIPVGLGVRLLKSPTGEKQAVFYEAK